MQQTRERSSARGIMKVNVVIALCKDQQLQWPTGCDILPVRYKVKIPDIFHNLPVLNSSRQPGNYNGIHIFLKFQMIRT